MIKIKTTTELEPIDLGSTHGLDKNEKYTRTVHFLGIRLWRFEDHRLVNVANTKFASLNKTTHHETGVGFKGNK